MPIRTRRGRAAAYRALWEWPLHSPVRLFACITVVVALAVGVSALGGLLSGPSPRSTSAGPVTLRPSATATAAPSTSAVPQAPPPELTPATLPLATAPSAALAVAERWTQAWATHPPGVTAAQWSAGLAPFTTDEYLGVLASVDPSNVPGSRVTGPARAVEVRPEAIRVQVPTDAVRLELLLVQVRPDDWRVSGYDRAAP